MIGSQDSNKAGLHGQDVKNCGLLVFRTSPRPTAEQWANPRAKTENQSAQPYSRGPLRGGTGDIPRGMPPGYFRGWLCGGSSGGSSGGSGACLGAMESVRVLLTCIIPHP